MPSPKLPEGAFKARYREQFTDPEFDGLSADIERIAEVAWRAYRDSRKSPRTGKAGPGYADPDYDLSLDWIAAREAIDRAREQHDDPARPPYVLVIKLPSGVSITTRIPPSSDFSFSRERSCFFMS
jgi:hypothetical protein